MMKKDKGSAKKAKERRDKQNQLQAELEKTSKVSSFFSATKGAPHDPVVEVTMLLSNSLLPSLALLKKMNIRPWNTNLILVPRKINLLVLMRWR